MELANPWEKIATPKKHGDFNSRRIRETSQHDFWWVVDSDGKPGLGVEFKAEIDIPHTLPHLTSIKATISPNQKFLLLFLLDKEILTKFRILCHDLINETQSVDAGNSPKLLENLVSTLNRWKKLLETKKIKSPSLAQKLGLLGELNCLANFIAAHAGFRRAVDAWQGPKGHEQDFSINGHLIEVKAQLSSSDRVVKISSLEQLDTISGPIWLQHLGLSPASSEDSSAISINSVIQKILNGLAGDNFGIDIFVTLLEQQGFALENDYGDEFYTVPFRQTYEIRDDFPKITRHIIGSNAIVKADYSINMSDLNNWMAENNYVEAEIFS
jgi:hypothetical protein